MDIVKEKGWNERTWGNYILSIYRLTVPALFGRVHESKDKKSTYERRETNMEGNKISEFPAISFSQ